MKIVKRWSVVIDSSLHFLDDVVNLGSKVAVRLIDLLSHEMGSLAVVIVRDESILQIANGGLFEAGEPTMVHRIDSINNIRPMSSTALLLDLPHSQEALNSKMDEELICFSPNVSS